LGQIARARAAFGAAQAVIYDSFPRLIFHPCTFTRQLQNWRPSGTMAGWGAAMAVQCGRICGVNAVPGGGTCHRNKAARAHRPALLALPVLSPRECAAAPPQCTRCYSCCRTVAHAHLQYFPLQPVSECAL